MYVEELKKFTSSDITRKHIFDVGRCGKYAVATDGCVMAFTDNGCVDSLPDMVLSDSDIIPGLIKQHNELVFKPFTMPELPCTPCLTCHGSGTVCFTACYECDGHGYINLQSDYNSYDVDCKSCDGNGRRPSMDEKDIRPCGCFNGLEFDGFMALDGFNIDPRYLFPIKEYPALEMALCDVDKIRAKLFHFKSGNGIHVIIMGAIS